jgi:hypothetical protein
VSGVIDQLGAVFGNEAPLSIIQKKLREYLGMTLDFTSSGRVSVKMDKYVRGMLMRLLMT